jgi:hypothetical protein
MIAALVPQGACFELMHLHMSHPGGPKKNGINEFGKSAGKIRQKNVEG